MAAFAAAVEIDGPALLAIAATCSTICKDVMLSPPKSKSNMEDNDEHKAPTVSPVS